MSDLIPATGLWEKTNKNGETYFTGNMGVVSVVIFKNKHKSKQNDPDWNMYLSKKKAQEEHNSNNLSEDDFAPF